MKLRSWLLLGVGIVVVGIGVAVAVLLSSLDSLVKQAIEEYGSEITGTAVRLQSVEIDLRNGKGSLLGLRVANPEGYGGGDIISFGEITLGLELESLAEQKPLVVSVVRVGAPTVNFVVDERGVSNLQKLQQNIQRNSGASGGSSESAGGTEGPPTLITIRSFTFEDGKVAADLTAAGGERMETALAAVRMSNVGGKSGAEASEIAEKIAREFVNQTVISVGRSQAQKQVDKLLDKHVGGQEGEAAKKLLNNLMGK